MGLFLMYFALACAAFFVIWVFDKIVNFTYFS